MFEISQLKEKKLADLQEIAKKLNVPKFRSLKKLDLVYQILDQQAADPKAVTAVIEPKQASETPTEKKPEPRKPRQRVQKPVKNTPAKQETKPKEEKTVVGYRSRSTGNVWLFGKEETKDVSIGKYLVDHSHVSRVELETNPLRYEPLYKGETTITLSL